MEQAENIRMEFMDVETVMLDNLRLLGFDEHKHELALYPGLFNKSNPSAGDKIFYFLFSRLRPNQYEKDFQGMWPHYGKAQATQYRKVAHGLIYELENVGAIPKSHSSRSTLANCQGDRFVKLLWHLSAHTLRTVYKASPSVALTSDQMHEILKDAPRPEEIMTRHMTSMAQERAHFLEMVAVDAEKQRKWRALADDIAAEYQVLTEKLEVWEGQIASLQPMAVEGRKEAAEQRMLTAKVQWEALASYTEKSEKMSSGAVADVIANTAHRYAVHGESLRAAMSDGGYISSAAGGPGIDKTPISNRLSALRSRGYAGNGATLQGRLDSGSEQLGSDGAISWPKMVQNLRSSLDSPGKALMSPRDKWRIPEVDLVTVLERLIGALRQICTPVQLLEETAGSLDYHILSDASQVPGGAGHSHQLEATLAEHRQHLTEAQDLAERVMADVQTGEETVESLRQQIDIKDPALTRNERTKPQHAWNGGGIPSPSHETAQDVPLGLVPPTPAARLPDFTKPVPLGEAREFDGGELRAEIARHFGLFSVLDGSGGGSDENSSLWPSLCVSASEAAEQDFVERTRKAVREAALRRAALSGAGLHEKDSDGPPFAGLVEKLNPEAVNNQADATKASSSAAWADLQSTQDASPDVVSRRSSLPLMDAVEESDFNIGLLASSVDADLEFNSLAVSPGIGIKT